MLRGSIDETILNSSLSMVLSIDSMATISIYFIPKFIKKETPRVNNASSTSGRDPNSGRTDGSASNRSDFFFTRQAFTGHLPQERAALGHRVCFSGEVSVLNHDESWAASNSKNDSCNEVGLRPVDEDYNLAGIEEEVCSASRTSESDAGLPATPT